MGLRGHAWVNILTITPEALRILLVRYPVQQASSSTLIVIELSWVLSALSKPNEIRNVLFFVPPGTHYSWCIFNTYTARPVCWREWIS